MVLGHVGQCVPELHRMAKEGKLSRECVGGETNPPAELRGGDSSSNAALGIGHLKWQGMGWLHGKSYCPSGLHSNRLAIQHKIIEMRAPLRKAIVLVPKLRSKRSGGIKFAVVFEQWLPY